MKIYDFNGCNNISGNKIREERIKRGLNQKDLATQMQLRGVVINRDSISRIESGRRFVTDYEIKILAEIFGVSTDYLLGE